MKLRYKVLLGVIVTCGICCGLPSFWYFAPARAYPVGGNIRDLGLDRFAPYGYRWVASSREPIKAFLARTGTSAAHFNGSIVLSRPGNKYDETQIGIQDGKYSYTSGEFDFDTTLADDMRALRSGRLSKMLEQTKNDWRILNQDDHFIGPTGPFTGEIEVDQKGTSVFLEITDVITVKDDVIQSVRRRIIPLPD